MKWIDVILRRVSPPDGERATKRRRVDILEAEAQAAVREARKALEQSNPHDVARLRMIDAQIELMRVHRRRWS